MEKQKEIIISYKGISKTEQYILSVINRYKLVVFDFNKIHRLSGLSKSKLYNSLFSLKNKHILESVQKGKYLLKDRIPGNEFMIANSLTSPSYISFWSALSYYGWTEQQPINIQIISINQFKEFQFGAHNVEVTTFASSRFYGYKHISNFSIATKEKAIVDSLSDFELVGGLQEFSKCLKNGWNELNKNTLINFLIRFKNRSMNSRFGFLIEKLNLKISKSYINRLLDNCSAGFVKLEPSGLKSRSYNKKWKIIENSKGQVE
jgi:predicted transcriptional regulator of viral defense system